MISILKYSDKIYGIICKKKYQVEKKYVINPEECLKLKIPLIKKNLNMAIVIYKKLKE